MLARYYSSSLGRFLSVDRDGANPANPQSWNKYAYVRNNPLILKDSDGEAAMAVTAAAGFVIGGIVGMAIEAGTQLANGQELDLQDVGAVGWGGAVTGGLAGQTGGASLLGSTALATAASSGLAGAAGGMASRALDSDPATQPANPSAMAVDTVASAGAGVGGGMVEE